MLDNQRVTWTGFAILAMFRSAQISRKANRVNNQPAPETEGEMADTTGGSETDWFYIYKYTIHKQFTHFSS